jgi:hypothetical protein
VKVDIGAKRPIEGDQVYAVGRFLNSEPPFALLYDPSKSTIPTRYPRRKLGGDPESVVGALGGPAVFARLDVPDWGTVWIRRSMVLDVQPMPPEHARLSGKYTFGANVLMRFQPPLVPRPFLPSDVPLGFGAHGLTTEEVRVALGL